MSQRPLLSGVPTVEVDQFRYDELLHKEAKLQTVFNLLKTGWELKADILKIFVDDMVGDECE